MKLKFFVSIAVGLLSVSAWATDPAERCHYLSQRALVPVLQLRMGDMAPPARALVSGGEITAHSTLYSHVKVWNAAGMLVALRPYEDQLDFFDLGTGVLLHTKTLRLDGAVSMWKDGGAEIANSSHYEISNDGSRILVIAPNQMLYVGKTEDVLNGGELKQVIDLKTAAPGVGPVEASSLSMSSDGAKVGLNFTTGSSGVRAEGGGVLDVDTGNFFSAYAMQPAGGSGLTRTWALAPDAQSVYVYTSVTPIMGISETHLGPFVLQQPTLQKPSIDMLAQDYSQRRHSLRGLSPGALPTIKEQVVFPADFREALNDQRGHHFLLARATNSLGAFVVGVPNRVVFFDPRDGALQHNIEIEPGERFSYASESTLLIASPVAGENSDSLSFRIRARDLSKVGAPFVEGFDTLIRKSQSAKFYMSVDGQYLIVHDQNVLQLFAVKPKD